jgi:hypothetical protein
MLQGDLNLISMHAQATRKGKGPKRMKQHHWHPKNQPKKPNTVLDGVPSQNMQRRYGQPTCLKHPNRTWRNQNKNQHDTRERRKGQNYIMKTLWKGNRLKGLYKGTSEGKELKEGMSTIKWIKPNSFVLFKKTRTWNWKLKWHATIAKKIWLITYLTCTIYFYNKI